MLALVSGQTDWWETGLYCITPGISGKDPVRDNEVLVTRAPVETEQILAGLENFGR